MGTLPLTRSNPQYWRNLARIKKRQAAEAESLAGVASGIGEHGIANNLWRLESILRQQRSDCRIRAEDLESKAAAMESQELDANAG